MTQTLARSGGIPIVGLSAAGGTAEVALHGAHLLSWTPAGGEPVLWTSAHSLFADGEPIRGGVPICFPWFGPSRARADEPQHGFARLREWELVDLRSADDTSAATFRLTDTAESRQTSWPHRFIAYYTVTVGETLHLSLEIENRDDRDFSFDVSLHSYFAIRGLADVSLHGLPEQGFVDGQPTEARMENGAIVIDGAITRVFPTAATAILEDAAVGRRIRVEAAGLDSIVVWNPGPEQASAMDDFGDSEWSGMLCIENCAIGGGAVRLAPGERRVMTVTMTAEQLV